MTCVRTVLIVGAGTAGTALAILLRRAGVDVELSEIKPSWNVSGSGITLQGAALRILRELGVYAEVEASGYPFNDMGLRTPGGGLITEWDNVRTGGPDLPAVIGMNRPELAEILTSAALRAGVQARLGCSPAKFIETPAGVEVRFDDGTHAVFDLVVGADGVHSHVRSLIGIDTVPQPMGMGVWRVHARRPAGLTRTDLVYGGPAYLAGYCPTSANTIYAYLSEKARDRSLIEYERMPEEMLKLAVHYGGFWDQIRADIADPARVNYSLTEYLLVNRPWNRGRVVIIGDAAHACPPSLALGAAMALEDAAVLAGLLVARDAFDESVFQAFMDRRFDRVRLVVESSVKLTQWQLDQDENADVAGLIAQVNATVSLPP